MVRKKRKTTFGRLADVADIVAGNRVKVAMIILAAFSFRYIQWFGAIGRPYKICRKVSESLAHTLHQKKFENRKTYLPSTLTILRAAIGT